LSILLIIHGLAADDAAKMRAVFDEYKYLMMKVALSYVKDPHTAEDIVSMSLFKLRFYVDKLPAIPSRSAQSYITRTVKSVAIDYIRKSNRNASASLEQLMEETGFAPASDADTVEQSVLLSAAVDNIKDALNQLEEKQYQAVIYHKYFGLTLRETAEKMQVKSTSSVQSLVNSGIAKLKTAMHKGGANIAA